MSLLFLVLGIIYGVFGMIHAVRAFNDEPSGFDMLVIIVSIPIMAGLILT